MRREIPWDIITTTHMGVFGGGIEARMAYIQCGLMAISLRSDTIISNTQKHNSPDHNRLFRKANNIMPDLSLL